MILTKKNLDDNYESIVSSLAVISHVDKERREYQVVFKGWTYVFTYWTDGELIVYTTYYDISDIKQIKNLIARMINDNK